MINKAELPIPPLESASSSANVSVIPQDSFNQFLAAFECSQKVKQDILFELSKRLRQFDKGKSIDMSYSTKDLTPNLAAPSSMIGVEYRMPPNYFAG